MVIWITGKAGAGKTTLAKKIQTKLRNKNYSPIIIDGDRLRKIIDEGYSDDGRQKNIVFAAELASMIEEQGVTAIVAMVSPKKVWRDMAKTLFEESYTIYVEGGKLWEGTEYDCPTTTEADVVYDWRSSKIITNNERLRHLLE